MRRRFRFVAVYAVSQISKYLPGNVFQHIARFGLAVREGASSVRVVATITLESLVLVLVALVLALAALGDRALSVGPQVPLWMLASLGVVATIAVVTLRRKLLPMGREVLRDARWSLLLVIPLYLAFFALGGLGLTLPRLLQARDESSQRLDRTFGRAKRAIVLYLHGGHPQQETFDPKPQGPLAVRGEFAAIETAVRGVRFSELLPKTAARMHVSPKPPGRSRIKRG